MVQQCRLAIANLVFSYVSLNGNGYAFDQDFEILGFGNDSDCNDGGYWRCGTSTQTIVDRGGGNFEYRIPVARHRRITR